MFHYCRVSAVSGHVRLRLLTARLRRAYGAVTARLHCAYSALTFRLLKGVTACYAIMESVMHNGGTSQQRASGTLLAGWSRLPCLQAATNE